MLDLAPYVQSWMDTLARQRPLFHSESDFQLALALVLADDVAQLRLEKNLSVSESVGGRSRLSIDVLGELDGHRIALELKYPKKRLRTSVDGEVFDLPASGAPDLDTAAIWRDVQRIERLVLDESVVAGLDHADELSVLERTQHHGPVAGPRVPAVGGPQRRPRGVAVAAQGWASRRAADVRVGVPLRLAKLRRRR